MRESPQHVALVQLFRDHPALAITLARRAGIAVPDGCTSVVTDPALKPTGLAADVMSLLKDADGTPRLALIVEIQRGVDHAKKRTWPVYYWLTRLILGCECALLVVATGRRVAAWAGVPILGDDGSGTRVHVTGPDNFPCVEDRGEACADPAFAVLSAALHSKDIRVVAAAYAALSALPPAMARQYHPIVFFEHKESAVMQHFLDLSVDPSNPDVEVVDNDEDYIDDILDDEAALDRVCATTARNAPILGPPMMWDMLLIKLRGRGLVVTRKVWRRVKACRDFEQLTRWYVRADSIERAEALFE